MDVELDVDVDGPVRRLGAFASFALLSAPAGDMKKAFGRLTPSTFKV